MSNLTQAALFSKKAFFWVVIAISIIVALIVLFGLGKNIYISLFPPKPVPATVAFGKIPAIDLSDGVKPIAATYKLQTISGGLPDLGSYAKVFSIMQPSSSFGSLDKVKQMASAIGFTSDPVEISPGTVKFTDPKEADRSLTFQLVNGNFTLDSGYLTDPQIIGTSPKSQDDAILKATTFLGNMGIDLNNFPKEKIVARTLRIDGGKLVEIPGLTGSNLIEVDFVREDLDKLPVVSSHYKVFPADVIVSENKIVAASVNALPIQKFSFATYPLKGTSQAFEELKAGHCSFNMSPAKSNIIILGVSLGYIESFKNSAYLQPYYLFNGVDGFTAYVPAVSDAWIK